MYIYKRVSIVKFVVSHLRAGKREGGPPAVPLPARSELAIIGVTREPGAARRGIVVRIDLMKQHLCDVLYDMCETRRLAEITLTDVAREAGVSRQTLYNHFIDLDDLNLLRGVTAALQRRPRLHEPAERRTRLRALVAA